MKFQKLRTGTLWGWLVLALASVLFAVMAVLVKVAIGSIPGPEAALLRFSSGLVACLGAHCRWTLRPKNKRALFNRGLYGGVAVCLYYIAMVHLPVGLATLLMYTSPVFTAVYAVYFLKDRPTIRTYVALTLTALGVLLVIKATTPVGSLFGWWQLLAVLAAGFSGVSLATISELRRSKEGSWEIFTAFCLGGIAVSLLLWAGQLWSWVSPSPKQWLILMLASCISVVSQLMLSYGYGFFPDGKTAASGIIFQITPVAALAMDWLIFGHELVGLTLAGVGITIFGIIAGITTTNGTKQ